MATYLILYKYTEKGVQNIKDAPTRVDAARKAAEKVGIRFKETLWLQGEYDFMAVTESEDETAAAAFGLNIAKQGNVRAVTMRAFTIAEMEKIVAKVD